MHSCTAQSMAFFNLQLCFEEETVKTNLENTALFKICQNQDMLGQYGPMWSANCRCGLTRVFADYKAEDIHSDRTEYQGVPCGVSKYPFLKPVWPTW